MKTARLKDQGLQSYLHLPVSKPHCADSWVGMNMIGQHEALNLELPHLDTRWMSKQFSWETPLLFYTMLYCWPWRKAFHLVWFWHYEEGWGPMNEGPTKGAAGSGKRKKGEGSSWGLCEWTAPRQSQEMGPSDITVKFNMACPHCIVHAATIQCTAQGGLRVSSLVKVLCGAQLWPLPQKRMSH